MGNPAERLLNILVEGLNHKSDQPCQAVWRRLLSADGQDDAELVARLGKVMLLPEEIGHLIKEHYPEERADQDYWISRVTVALKQQNLDQNWETFRKFIDGHTVSYLRMAAKLLSFTSGNGSLEQEKIAEIRESVSDLLVEVRNSNLSVSAKSFLIRSLQRIVGALDEYAITGELPILDAIETVYGHVVANPTFRAEMQESDISAKLWSTLSIAASFVTVATGVPQIASDISGLINALPKP